MRSHFIPSVFCSVKTDAHVRANAPFLEAQRNTVEYLKSKEIDISLTSFVNGLTFD